MYKIGTARFLIGIRTQFQAPLNQNLKERARTFSFRFEIFTPSSSVRPRRIHTHIHVSSVFGTICIYTVPNTEIDTKYKRTHTQQ